MNEKIKDFLKKITTADQRNAVRRAYRKVRLYIPPGTLEKFGKLYGTDKGDGEHTFKGLTYLDVYEKYIKPLRRKRITLLEIGVLGGGSLRMWKRYFPKGRIFGLDINPEAKKHEEERVRIEIGSQDDERVLEKVSGTAGAFDIIIDDGSHINEHIIKSFKCLFPKLRKGGLYVIEDLGCTYEDNAARIEKLVPGKHLPNRRADLDEVFRKIISDMDHHEGEILSIHFWPYMAIITKV